MFIFEFKNRAEGRGWERIIFSNKVWIYLYTEECLIKLDNMLFSTKKLLLYFFLLLKTLTRLNFSLQLQIFIFWFAQNHNHFNLLWNTMMNEMLATSFEDIFPKQKSLKLNFVMPCKEVTRKESSESSISDANCIYALYFPKRSLLAWVGIWMSIYLKQCFSKFYP